MITQAIRYWAIILRANRFRKPTQKLNCIKASFGLIFRFCFKVKALKPSKQGEFATDALFSKLKSTLARACKRPIILNSQDFAALPLARIKIPISATAE